VGRYPGVSFDSLGLVGTSPQAIKIRGFTATSFDRDQSNADTSEASDSDCFFPRGLQFTNASGTLILTDGRLRSPEEL
jgi:hypothetical protein